MNWELLDDTGIVITVLAYEYNMLTIPHVEGDKAFILVRSTAVNLAAILFITSKHRTAFVIAILWTLLLTLANLEGAFLKL